MRITHSLTAWIAVLLNVSLVIAVDKYGDVPGIGCFSSSGSLIDQGAYDYQSIGYCKGKCADAKFPVFALTSGSNCYCGKEVPSAKTSDSACSSPCQGYPAQVCGGPGAWWVALTGIATPASTAPAAVSSAAPTQTQIQRETITASASAAPSKGGSSKAGIAAGVVIGLLALASIAGGIWFFMRQRRRKDLEAAARANPIKSNMSTPDARLTFMKRQSNGSIADNQDYTRKILRVTNPE